MATQRWKSSLANIEARLRRSLGIAGPVGLDLPDPLPLMPVVLADDLTRPGAASPFRGRRFRIAANAFTVLAADNGSQTIVTDAPNGAIIDALNVQFVASAVADRGLAIQYWSPDQITALANGYAVNVRDNCVMVDPCDGPNTAPMFQASAPAIGLGSPPALAVIHSERFINPIDGDAMRRIPLNVWLPNGAGLSVRNYRVPGVAIEVITVWEGRVF